MGRTGKHNLGLRRSDGSERQKHDFYATKGEDVIPPLLEFMGWEKGGMLIRENSCGAGHLSKTLEEYNHKVVSSDLIDRGYGITGVDFLEDSYLDGFGYDATIMNPPFDRNVLLPFIKKALKQAPFTCAFLRITFLETPKRKKFFEENPFKYMLVFSKRPRCSKNGLFPKGEKGAVCYAWFIWEEGFRGQSIIKWI